MKKIFWTIYLRVTSEIDPFLKWVSAVCAAAAIAGISMGQVGSNIIIWKGQSLSNLLTIAGGIGVFVAQLSVNNKPVLDAKVEDKSA